MKKITIFFIALSLGIFLAYQLIYIEIINQDLVINFFDVGQGDSILIELGNSYQILVDGGPDEKVLDELHKAMPFGDRTIEIIILSHPDYDHLAGLVSVLADYQVEQVYVAPGNEDKWLYSAWLRDLRQEGVKINIVSGQQILNIGKHFQITFLHPIDDRIQTNVNNASVVFKLQHGQNSFLFPGDVEEEAEAVLVETYRDELKADVLKVPHHGSKTSSTQEFLNLVQPKLAVIQVSADNSYGHPSPRVLWRYKGVQIFRTDQEGTIELISDGQKICLKDIRFWKKSKRCIIGGSE